MCCPDPLSGGGGVLGAPAAAFGCHPSGIASASGRHVDQAYALMPSTAHIQGLAEAGMMAQTVWPNGEELWWALLALDLPRGLAKAGPLPLASPASSLLFHGCSLEVTS